MDVFYDPELPATHRHAWEQIEQLRDSLPARLIASGRQVRESIELLRAHGLACELDAVPDDVLALADALAACAGRVCDRLCDTHPTPLSTPSSATDAGPARVLAEPASWAEVRRWQEGAA